MTDPIEAFPDGLPFTEAQATIEKCIEMLAGRPRHCGRSAFRHLRKAWTLYPIDREMALFRAITAEEEAATALILALKQRRYPGAELLDYRRHDHKAGVAPFLHAVGKVLSVMEFARPKIIMSWGGDKPRLDVSVNAVAMGLSQDPDQCVMADEPFNFVVRAGTNSGRAQAMTFAEELAAFASDKGSSEILELIRKEANLRNKLLYAQDTGIPSVDYRLPLLLAKTARACVMLQVTIGILQTPMHQLFASQCLQAYLAAVRKLPRSGFVFEGDEADAIADQTKILVTKLNDAPPAAEVEITRAVRLDSIVVTADGVDINMTGLNDDVPYGVQFREKSAAD